MSTITDNPNEMKTLMAHDFMEVRNALIYLGDGDYNRSHRGKNALDALYRIWELYAKFADDSECANVFRAMRAIEESLSRV